MKTKSHRKTRRSSVAIAQACAVMLLAGCGQSGSAQSPAPSTTATTASTTTASTPTASTTPASPAAPPTTTAADQLDVVELSIHSAAGTKTVTSKAGANDQVELHVGDQLQITFHSTYWSVQSNSDSVVMATLGDPVVDSRLNGCLPGVGCGTVTVTFAAKVVGTSTVIAHRVSCGEALACTGTRGDYQVTATTS